MVFIAKVRQLSFKADLSNQESLLENQRSTYAVLRYADDIPSNIYNSVMSFLIEYIDEITDFKLFMLVEEYAKHSNVGLMDWEEEFVETLTLFPETGQLLEGEYIQDGNMLIGQNFASLEFDDEDDD